MRILIDIGHPAHVHYFHNFIKIMESKGHEFLIIARDKEVTLKLLSAFDIPYISRGSGGKGIIGKSLYLAEGDYFIFKKARKFNPDIFLSFASVYAAHVAKVLGKVHVAFYDTEHAILEHLLCFPFSETILTPAYFYKELGKKQIKFNGFMELCYLHPKYYKPDNKILSEIGVKENDIYTVLRFVSWEANHDFGKTGLTNDYKIDLLKCLHNYGKVFISAEGDLPLELEKYRLNIPPEKMHDLLFYSSLYIGEGATTASECAVLGIPAIYVNSLDAGTLKQQVKDNLLFSYRNSSRVLEKAVELIRDPEIKNRWQDNRKKMLQNNIDVTGFMVWFIENYPNSKTEMINDQNYQYNFR